MRLLILGAGGMLGHKLLQTARGEADVRGTVRGSAKSYERFGIAASELIGGVDVEHFDTVVKAFATFRPDAVVNCVGVVKQLESAKDPLVTLPINSLLPHRLANLCIASGARLVHISTDCVFSGRKGMYTEADFSDAEDLYGRSKFLGEVGGEGIVTLRTSIIGRELSTNSGLVEWFLANRGREVGGYTRAIFSGLTTQALSRVILDVLRSPKALSGLYQVSVDPISKYDLLYLLNDAYRAGATIRPDDTVAIDRSLDSTRFREATSFKPRPWTELVAEMAGDATPYDQWRKTQ